jgi:integrase
MDTVTSGFGARVSPKGKIAFFLYARLPDANSSSRHGLGEWCTPGFTLAEARKKASEWKAAISQGRNPKAEIEERKAAHRRQSRETLNAAIEEWQKFKVRKENRCEKSTRRRVLDLKRSACKEWGEKSILELSQSRSAIKAYLIELGEKSAASANRLHVTLDSIFSWAIDEEMYGIEINPCQSIRSKSYGYSRPNSGRPFTDEEIRALWSSATLAPYPWGAWFKFLLLTASRNEEATIARWNEIDFDKRMWTIPAAHAKGGGVEVRKPLSDSVLDLLKGLPRDARTVAGMGVHGNVLRFYDPAMVFGLREMEIAYNSQGCRKSPKQVINKRMPEHLKKWKFHWVRKSYRTHMSKHVLNVPERAIELFMGHHQKDAVKAAYDYHEYEDEMRRAAEIWADHIERIVAPPDPNVIPFQKKPAGAN